MAYPDLGTWNEHKPVQAEEGAVEIAEQLAWSAIVQLTAGRVAFTPVTIRPTVIEDDGSILLPRPCGGVKWVRVAGVEIPTTAYRIDDNAILVRTDGDVWTANGDMTEANTATDVTEVSYFPGWRPGKLLIWAAAELAREFYLAASGDKKCRLPKNVTAVTRQGVTFEMTPSIFTEGRTGIHEIDVKVA